MKKFFYAGIAGLILFEILHVYFIMPMPGSQQMRSVSAAYFLHSWRWAFRAVFGLLILVGLPSAFKAQRWVSGAFLVLAGVAAYLFNFEMAADTMFLQPRRLVMKSIRENKIPKEKLIVGIDINGQARAYPIQLIGYHHQVLDTVGGKPVMVTYCTVCRTGRVFEPVVNGRPETFRLVGMDHFNAMFEDETTRSWWRQSTGEAVTGKLAGQSLPEVFSRQMRLEKWLALHPNSLVMQPDTVFKEQYASMKNYDRGKGKSDLTRTDSLSWREKSWVVGVELEKQSIAFDWNRLKKEKTINGFVGSQPIVVALASDTASFVAFQRPSDSVKFVLRNDSLITDNRRYGLDGRSAGNAKPLTPVKAYQEFWHSWRTFHPNTARHE